MSTGRSSTQQCPLPDGPPAVESRAPGAQRTRTLRSGHIDPTKFINVRTTNCGEPGFTLSKAAIKQIQPFACTVPLLELTDDKIFHAFPDMPDADQRSHIYFLQILAERGGPFVGHYMIWSQVSIWLLSNHTFWSSSLSPYLSCSSTCLFDTCFQVRGIDPTFIVEFQAENVGKVIELPSCNYLIQAIVTFQNIRREAIAANDSALLLIGVKREADYRLLLATTKMYSANLRNMEDFETELVYTLNFMQAAQTRAPHL